MISRLLIVVLALLLLSGCATGSAEISLTSHPQPASLSDVLVNIKGDALIDLDAADAIAVAHNDLVAHACFPVLKKYVAPDTGKATVDQIKGVISGFEKARVERLAIEAKVGSGAAIPPDLKIGCAALLIDERNFIIRLSALIAGGAVPGAGALGPLLPR